MLTPFLFRKRLLVACSSESYAQAADPNFRFPNRFLKPKVKANVGPHGKVEMIRQRKLPALLFYDPTERWVVDM